MPRGDKGPRPGLPTSVGPDYVRAAYTDAELRLMRKTRSTAVHSVAIKFPDGKRVINVKDQAVYDAEWGIDDQTMVVWAKAPNREGNWVHYVKTKRGSIAVLEKRSKGGKTIRLWSGQFGMLDPNGPVLRCLILMGMAEIIQRPKKPEPAEKPKQVERKLTKADLEAAAAPHEGKPASHRRKDPMKKQEEGEAMAEAVRELAKENRARKAASEASFVASVSARFEGYRIEIFEGGQGVFKTYNGDHRIVLDTLKTWLQNRAGPRQGQSIAERMPSINIEEAVMAGAKGAWYPTEALVAHATDPKVLANDPDYPLFAQRVSSDAKEPKGWKARVRAKVDLREKSMRVQREDGSLGNRQKHYRYD